MEIVVFITFMIVPVFTIASFVMVLILRKQVKALKNLVTTLLSTTTAGQPANQQAMYQFTMDSI